MSALAWEQVPPADARIGAPIRCPGCGHLLVLRWRDGSLKPLVPNVFVDPRGRLTLYCPECDTRWRAPERRS